MHYRLRRIVRGPARRPARAVWVYRYRDDRRIYRGMRTLWQRRRVPDDTQFRSAIPERHPVGKRMVVARMAWSLMDRAPDPREQMHQTAASREPALRPSRPKPSRYAE